MARKSLSIKPLTPSIALSLALLTGACGGDRKPAEQAGGMGQSASGATGASGNTVGGRESGGTAGTNATGGQPAGQAGSSGSGNAGSPPAGAGKSAAADLARKLGRKPNFLIGMGNDLPEDYVWEKSGIYTLGSPLDLHYVYLTYGWQDWNAGGYFAQVVGAVDVKKGATPMASVWAITGQGENTFGVLSDEGYMGPYWEGAKLLMQRYAELDVPAVVHLEPDFWAFAQQQARGKPASVPARLHADCKGLPADITGMARCWVKLARDNAPKVVIGLHASEWGGESGKEVGEFLNALGAAETDLVVIDILDRDAGCFEDGSLPQCTRGGEFYLDESNKTSPNYSERLAFAKQVHDTTGKPILWWQLPFGVPSETPGGSPGRFRDNKVSYLFSHVQEFIDAGGVGAAFGTGAGEQTYITSDGGQFQKAVKAYYQSPVPLP
jgi:hypothetical protein